MCTVVVLRRPSHDWPVLIAANRDELRSRPWLPPARHWSDRPDVVAGQDELSGGSWLGLNDQGVVAAILNRTGSLGPAPGKRTRGELVLEALDHADAATAAAALADVNPLAYRSFNMVVVDNRDGYWLRHDGGDDPVAVQPLPDGLSMLTSADRNDIAAPRIALYLPRFMAAPVPDPETGDWAAWESLLGARERPAGGEPGDALNIDNGPFGTVSSSLVALPAPGLHGPNGERVEPKWLFADGPPDTHPHRVLSVS